VYNHQVSKKKPASHPFAFGLGLYTKKTAVYGLSLFLVLVGDDARFFYVGEIKQEVPEDS